jgi:hypothetical protein
MPPSEPSETGSESGKRSATDGITRTSSLAGIDHKTSLEGARLNTNSFPGAASAPGAGV